MGSIVDEYIGSRRWDKEPKGLYEPIGYSLQAGGKRLRPNMVLWACEMFGGRVEEALPVAGVIELFHNFTLMHDDVMDNATLRRGRPTVQVKWNKATAVLSGDQMLIEAYKMLEEVKEDKRGEITRLFNIMATEVCEGQQYDMDFEVREDVSIDEYVRMIRLKTAVLFATALRMGAYMGEGTTQEQQTIYDVGINMGLAFQLKDDYLDTYGDEKTFGKTIGGDICENKKTYLLLCALESEREKLRPWLEATKDFHRAEKIEAVRAIYETCGVRERVQQTIQQYTCQALTLLKTLPPDVHLKELITSLVNRDL